MVEINTIQDLIAFSNGEYGRGTSSKYLDVALTADLDFNDLKENDNPYNWHGCTGTWYVNFDGQGHKIDNIYFMTSSPSDVAWGFFYTLYGTIRNLNLTNLYVTGSANMAGLVSYLHGCAYNCKVSGHVENIYPEGADGYVAGLVRYIYSNSTAGGARVDRCAFSGTLKSVNGTCTGLVGNVESKNTAFVSNCIFIGDIYTNNAWIVGIASNKVIVCNCEFRGTTHMNVVHDMCFCGRDSDGRGHNCIVVLYPGSTGTLKADEASYYNFYMDSTIAAEAGYSVPSQFISATTEQLHDTTWLHNHGFAI